MKSLSKRGASRARPTMNVTPLVDIVLVLLIIFMVAIPAMEKGAQVTLPQVLNVEDASRTAAEPFVLSLTASGQMYFEDEPLAAEALATTLSDANEREPLRRVVLKADESARYADARALFATCRRVGFPGISLQVSESANASPRPAEEER